jgi:plasmid stabilization system protein ParE
VSSRKRHRVVLGRTAVHELRDSLDYLEQRSSGSSARILDEIDECVQRLRRFPESSPVDASAPALLLSPGAKGRSTHAAGFSIRYAFPVELGRDSRVVVVLSILHGKRLPVTDAEYLERFLAEIAKARAESR